MSDQRIVFTNPDGSVGVIIPAPGVPIERVVLDIPRTAVASSVVSVDAIPKDRAFRAAWRSCPVNGVREDLDAARECAHGIRRAKRTEAFAPYDEVIAKQIPGQAEAAEAERQAIRDENAALQVVLDAAPSVDELRAALAL